MSQYVADFRAKNPEYNDMDDSTLVESIHAKYYSDIPIGAFSAKIGFDSSIQQEQPIVDETTIEQPLSVENAENLQQQPLDEQISSSGMVDETLSSEGIIEKTPEEKGMLDLIGDKVSNMGAGFAQRSNELVGNLAGFVSTQTKAAKFGIDELAFAAMGDSPKAEAFKEKWKAKRVEEGKVTDELADSFRKTKFYDYKEGVSTEDIKKSYKEGGLLNTDLITKVAEFGVEQGVKSIPDMVAMTYALPAYIMSRSEEMGGDRAENKGKQETEMIDVIESVPFVTASIVFDKIGLKGMTNAFKREAGDEIVKAGFKYASGRIAKEGAKAGSKEALTEYVQEGIIEYVGEKWGTQAEMTLADSFERGAFGALAGGLMGGPMGAAGGAAVELSRAEQAKKGAVEPAPEPEAIPEGFVVEEEKVQEPLPDPEVEEDFTPEEKKDIGITGEIKKVKPKAEDQTTVEGLLRGSLSSAGIQVAEGDVFAAFDQKNKYGQEAVDKAVGNLAESLSETFPDRFDAQRDEPISWVRENFGEDVGKKIVETDFEAEKIQRDEGTPYIVQAIEEGLSDSPGQSDTVENMLGDKKRVKIYLDGETYSLTKSGDSIFLNGKDINKTDVTGRTMFAGEKPIKVTAEKKEAVVVQKPESAFIKKMPESVSIGLGSFKPKPISKKLYRETNIQGINSLLRDVLSDNPERGATLGIYVTDDKDLAIGQGKNKGVNIEFDGDLVSGEINKKPGTGIIGGNEYVTTYINRDAIERFTIPKNTKLKGASGIFANRQFDKVTNEDGTRTYTRKDLNKPVESTKMGMKAPVVKDAAHYKGIVDGRKIDKLKEDNKHTLPKIRTDKVFLNNREALEFGETSELDKLIDSDKVSQIAIESVNVSDIIPTQRNININNLEKVIGSELSNGDDAILFKKGSKYYIIDGHHRVANRIINGDKTIKIRVYDSKTETKPSTKMEMKPAKVTKLPSKPVAAGDKIKKGIPFAEFQKEIKAKNPEIEISISGSKDKISLNKIIVPEGKRKLGSGSKVMNDIISFADENGKTITLNPTSEFGGTKSRLIKFYKSFGFVENKGKNKDYEISDDMYRESKAEKSPTKLNALGADKPGSKYQMTYSAMGFPDRPTNDMVSIGDKEIKLKPEDKPTRREGIQAQVEAIIGPRLYNSKIKNKSALGTYDKQNSEVRTKDYHAVEILSHEMAHFMDFHHKMKKQFTNAYEGDFLSLGEVSDLSYTTKKGLQEAEGFAEYVRLWLTQYDKAVELAPNFTKRFEAVLKRDKSMNRKMQLLQADMHRWLNQGDLARLAAVTSGNQYTAKERFTRLMNRRPSSLQRQKYIDHIHAAKVITADVKGHLGDATTDPYKQLQLLNGLDGIFEQSVKHGAPKLDESGNIGFTGPSLEDVWGQSIKHSVGRLRNQEQYFIARRAVETTKQDRENLITAEMMREGLALGRKYPYFKESFKKYQEYRENQMKFYVETGYLDAKAAKTMMARNKSYVPFHRVTEGVIESGKGSGASFQTLKGGTQNIKHVYDNILMQDSKHMQAALKAKALRDLYSEGLKSQEGSKWFTEIDSGAKPVEVMLEQMIQKTKKMSDEMGLETEFGIDEEIEGYFKEHPEELMFWSFGNKPSVTETMIDSFIDKDTGERVWVELNKENELLPDMLEALGGFALPKGIAGTALSVAMKVKQFQTLTITSMMQFAGPNIIRDQQQAYFLSGGRYRPLIDPVKGLYEYLKSSVGKSALFDEMLAQGGPGGGRVNTFLENDFGFVDTKSYKAKKPFYHPAQIAKDVLDIYVNIMDSAEMATRIGFYSRMISDGKSPREAAFMAREISTDFAKHGSYAPFVLLQRTVPFFGAYVQSVDRDLRGMFERNGKIRMSNFFKNPNGEEEYTAFKAKMVGIGMLYVSIHISLALLGDDEEAYKELTPDQKARFFHYFIDGEHYTIPKPHGLVTLMGSFAEGMTDLLRGQESETVKKDIMFAIAYHLGADAMPGILNPVSELALNKTFTGAPIVGRGVESRSEEYQYSDRTPQLYVRIGKALGVSPDKARHVVKGYTGYIEEIIAENTEEYLWDYEAWGERPNKRSYGQMISKQFSPKKIPFRTKYTSGYYDLKNRATTAKADFSFGISEAHRDKKTIKDVTKQKQQLTFIGLDKLFKKVDGALKSMKQGVSNITYNKNLSGEEKTKQIENMYAQKNKLLKDVYFSITKTLNEIEGK